MKGFLEKISEITSKAFADCGYDASYGKVSVSNRPDLCEYQCNGAMAAAKAYHKAPFMIADEVVAKLAEEKAFSLCESVKPGFINLNISEEFLTDYLGEMAEAGREGRFGAPEGAGKKVVMDYGGPNVAKPLHVGHLRSAIIGESIKRIRTYMGDQVTGDVHLGDWGLQMGLIIEELKDRQPSLCYFDPDFTGEYPKEAPFTLSELEEIYPAANARKKDDLEFAERAHYAVVKIQQGDPAYMALWKHIMDLSLPDLKRNYDRLDVFFDLWMGESDSKPFIEDMINSMKESGVAYKSEGALVVDVTEETDSKEIPPCIVQKSDGAAIYATSDLATIVWRERNLQPDMYIYVTDKRQELHFTQVFRTARKAGIVPENREMKWMGFGTMNGKDGKPFKPRDGGVMRLETLIGEVNSAVLNKVKENRSVAEEDAEKTAEMIGLAAIKYGDLSNQASKDYIFDIDRFTSFDGNTGPYILYTIVRIRSILKKYEEETGKTVATGKLSLMENASAKAMMQEMVKWNEMLTSAYEENAPHKICAYLFGLCDTFNSFYHETKIIGEEDEAKKQSYLSLITLALEVLETAIFLLGFSAPERM
ncbi:MAG: arginine--tRNA ligase [Lachnospiraceae bacterium]|nr:arginine--tRNA ligase [Lachnospiraceae bacterium]